MYPDNDSAFASTSPQNAAEAVQQLTEQAHLLAATLNQLTGSLQQSSSNNASSTLQHLAIYDEAVQSLQVLSVARSCRLVDAK